MIRSDNSGLQALRARAYALAESGQFANAHAVEQALVAEGWPNIHRALAGDYWQAPVRQAIHSAGSTLLDQALPSGIVHHYLVLGRAHIAADGSINHGQKCGRHLN